MLEEQATGISKRAGGTEVCMDCLIDQIGWRRSCEAGVGHRSRAAAKFADCHSSDFRLCFLSFGRVSLFCHSTGSVDSAIAQAIAEYWRAKFESFRLPARLREGAIQADRGAPARTLLDAKFAFAQRLRETVLMLISGSGQKRPVA